MKHTNEFKKLRKMKNTLILGTIAAVIISFTLSLSSCNPKTATENDVAESEALKDVAYDAFIYAFPMMEQVKTLNGMFQFMGMVPNVPSMNPNFPMDNVGQPIVAPNLTSMTGGIFIDISGGPVTVEVPEVKDRYVVYQFVDMFTHNFFYLGTSANGGEAGQFVFYNKTQKVPQNTKATPVLVEGDHAVLINRIDIKGRNELEYVKSIQANIKVVNASITTKDYPAYDKEKAFSPAFVDYLNQLIISIPESELEMFKRFSAIGVKSEVNLSDEDLVEIQQGIDSAFAVIDNETKNLEIGNDYFGATEVFGTREFLNGNYLGRATGAHFGLWGNSKAEANYFMLKTTGEGEIRFAADELPPLSEIGFWSVTVHDENVHVTKNEFDSYVLTMDQMQFEDDGSLILKVSSSPEEGNWLYAPAESIVVLIRVYQADVDRIGSYVPPAWVQK